MGETLIVAEKPSVARDIASVLGARGRGDGFLHGGGWTVTWCIGHLVGLKMPEDYEGKSWDSWALEPLPMVPDSWGLKAIERTKDHYDKVAALLTSPGFDRVVNACDAGREGELIFGLVYELSGSTLPAERLWISSMTEEAIRQGLASLRPASQTAPLLDAAKARDRADWLVGLNATRALTLKVKQAQPHFRGVLSVGRVQTPTLGLLVSRHREIEAFVPKDYWEVHAQFDSPRGESYTGKLIGEGGEIRRFEAQAPAKTILGHMGQGPGLITTCEQAQGRRNPPQAFDLTSLQREANTRLGLSAQRTLDLAQALYEKHKVTTYPRTDSRYITPDLASQLPSMFEGLRDFGPTEELMERFEFDPSQKRPHLVDASKVTDHHAILPTGKSAEGLAGEEEALFEMIARRTLAVLSPPALTSTTVVHTEVAGHTLLTRGTQILDPGWMAFERDKQEKEDDSKIPGDLSQGAQVSLAQAVAYKGRTKPPSKLTEASLLRGMETAGKSLEDEELEAIMKEGGLGTPATRAGVIETLLARGYIERAKKSLVPTTLGLGLIDALAGQPELTSAQLTGQWELGLDKMAKGQVSLEAFMGQVEGYCRHVIAGITQGKGARGIKVEGPEPLGACPQCAKPVMAAKSGAWCQGLRQKECSFFISRQIAKKTLTDGQLAALLTGKLTKVIKGFVSSTSGKTFEAPLKLVRDDEAGRWGVAFAFEQPALLPVACPTCLGQISAGKHFVSCGGCGLKVWRSVAGVALSDKQLEALFLGDTVGPLKGFKTQAGGSFEASLKLGEGPEGVAALEFIFPEQAQAQPMGITCPLCKQGEVSLGEKAASCSGCDLKVWRTVAGKELSAEHVSTLIGGEAVGPLKGFKSRAGKTFSASLVLATEGEHKGRLEFVFKDHKKA